MKGSNSYDFSAFKARLTKIDGARRTEEDWWRHFTTRFAPMHDGLCKLRRLVAEHVRDLDFSFELTRCSDASATMWLMIGSDTMNSMRVTLKEDTLTLHQHRGAKPVDMNYTPDRGGEPTEILDAVQAVVAHVFEQSGARLRKPFRH